MNNIKAIFLIIVFSVLVFLPVIAEAQYLNLSNNNTSSFNKLNTSVSLSSSFTNYGYGTTAFSTTIMPSFSKKINKKLDVTAGIGYSTLFISNEGSVFNTSPDSYAHIFVSGIYQLNNKISISGTGYGTFLLNNTSPVVEGESFKNDFSNKGFIMDIEYKVNDQFKINVGFEYRDQNQSFYPGNTMFLNDNGFGGSQLGGNPFTTGRGF